MKYILRIKWSFLTLIVTSSLLFWMESIWHFTMDNTFYQEFGFSAMPVAITMSLLLFPFLIAFNLSERTRPFMITWWAMALPAINLMAIIILTKDLLQLLG